MSAVVPGPVVPPRIQQCDTFYEAQRIVRAYSFEIEERILPDNSSYQLSRVLAETRGDVRDLTSPWRKFFEASDHSNNESQITDFMRVESTKLREKWLEFHGSFDGDDQLDLARSEPTVQAMVVIVQNMQTKWQNNRKTSRRSKIMHQFRRMCGFMNSHKAMLQLLPDGNEYVAIFTGTLNVILKASVNYERVAEGLSEALCDISELVADCEIEVELFKTKKMIDLIVDLYAHTFIFLSDVMEYLMQKRRLRLLKSFNEDLYQKFEKQIQSVQKKSERIKNTAAQNSRAEQRVSRLEFVQFERDVRLGLGGLARQQAEMMLREAESRRQLAEAQENESRRQQQAFANQLAGLVVSMLEQDAQSWMEDRLAPAQMVQGYATQLFAYSPTFMSTLSRSPSPAAFPWTASEIILSSTHVEDFFERSRVRLLEDWFQPVLLPSQAIQQLSEWTRKGAGFLHLEGPALMLGDFMNPLTMLAARFVDLAEQSKVSVISYFCHLPRGQILPSRNVTREMQACVSLASGLLRQIMELLLPTFESSKDFSVARLKSINGTADSWLATIRLIEDLLKTIGRPTLIVIDGFHWLDDSSTNMMLAELIHSLRAGRSKVFVTSTGRSACLRRELKPTETIRIESFKGKAATWMLGRDDLEFKEGADSTVA